MSMFAERRVEVRPDHSAEIRSPKAMHDLPDGLSPAERARIERHLVEQARMLDPARLRRAARRALQALRRPESEVDDHQGATLRSEEEQARARPD